eukprot:671228-Prorocentrum_lima.AAC.1
MELRGVFYQDIEDAEAAERLEMSAAAAAAAGDPRTDGYADGACSQPAAPPVDFYASGDAAGLPPQGEVK